METPPLPKRPPLGRQVLAVVFALLALSAWWEVVNDVIGTNDSPRILALLQTIVGAMAAAAAWGSWKGARWAPAFALLYGVIAGGMVASLGPMLDLPAGDRIRVNVADGLPPVAVDADQIQRVLANVLDNALKYSAAGVEVLAHTDGVRVLVDVLDEGGAPIRPGLGLGLTIAHGFAEANGATLELLPREGGGTRARLSLPMQRIPEAVAT